MEMKKNELELSAEVDNLNTVISFVDELLEAADCPMKTQMQVELAVEEIFVNIASYAYAPGTGTAAIKAEVGGEPAHIVITFIDHGVKYDPLEKEDPDVTLPASERGIGGLGIFLTRKNMDDVRYEYRDGCNILTLTKRLVSE